MLNLDITKGALFVNIKQIYQYQIRSCRYAGVLKWCADYIKKPGKTGLFYVKL